MLVASGMDTNVRDFDGLIPADLASECGHTKCAIFLRSPSQVNVIVMLATNINFFTNRYKKFVPMQEIIC